MAERLALPGFGDWTELVPEDAAQLRRLDRIRGDLGWVRNHVLPFALQRARGIPYGTGREAKRPEPVVVPKSSVRTA